MALLMTQTAFAGRHGVTKPTVSAWKSKGLLVFADDPERPGKKLVDAELSDKLVRATIDQTRGRPRSADQAQAELAASDPVAAASPTPARGYSGLEAARLEEMTERTRRRRIETEQLLGNLVAVAEYERRAGDLGRLVRERVQATVRQLAERLAAETDPRKVITLLGDAFDALFNQVADEIEAEAQTERQVDAELAPLADEDAADEDDAAGLPL